MRYLSLSVNGQTINPPTGVATGGLNTFIKILRNSLNIVLIIAVILCLFFLVWGGIQWITSAGDKTKVQAARNRLTWAIIGLVLTLLSFFLLSALGTIFGVNLQQL